jgi:hypothetical protein
MCLTIELSLGEVYPFPPIRGQRITRLEEADLGPFQLDGETAERLAEDNVGVFVGGCRDLDWMMDRLAILAETDFPARWLVVLASEGLADIVYRTLTRKPGSRRRTHAPTSGHTAT